MNKNKLIKHIEETIEMLERNPKNQKHDELVAAIGGKVALRQLLVLITNNKFDD